MIELNMSATPPNINTGSEAKASTNVNSVQQQVKPSVDLKNSNGNSTLEKELSSMEIKNLTDDLNRVSDSLNTDVKFGYNDKLNEFFITVTDKNTGREIQKLPTEQAMKLKETMKDMVGSLFDMKG